VKDGLFWPVLLSPSEMERLLEAARWNILGSSAAVLVCWPLYVQYVYSKLMEWSGVHPYAGGLSICCHYLLYQDNWDRIQVIVLHS
jgi:hypothetical protein